MAPKLSAAFAIAAALLITGTLAVAAEPPQGNDVTAQFASAKLPIADFKAIEVGGIVVLRGATYSATDAAAAGTFATTIGYPRVANLIRVVDPPDDAAIRRDAERRLATRSLDGCDFHIASADGVVRVTGKVQYELQKDIALSLLRSIDGVREVHAQLDR